MSNNHRTDDQVALASADVRILSPRTPQRPISALPYISITESNHEIIEYSDLSSPSANRHLCARSPTSSMDRLTTKQYSRQRSSSFGAATSEVNRKKTKLNLDLPVRKATSWSSINRSSDCLYGHSSSGYSHPHTTSTLSQCFSCDKERKIKTLTEPSDLIFDHLRGEIRHRPKTAFGSTMHQAAKSSAKNHHTQSKLETPLPHKKVKLQPLAADQFINECIIISETRVIKQAEKPKASPLFCQIMGELLPTHENLTDIYFMKPKPAKGAATLNPSSSAQSSGTIHCGRRLKIRQSRN